MLYCFSLKSENSRPKNQNSKNLALSEVSLRYWSFFWFYQFLLMFHLGL